MILGVRFRWWCLALLLALGATAFAQTASRPVLLVLGDSLSAEYGLPRDTGWVKLLADKLATLGPEGAAQYSVVNASISGETTSGGRTRLPALLAQNRPAIVIIELGGNDGLRGLPVQAMQENLAAMVDASQKSGARVLLVGLRIPPNYGRDYTEGFANTFTEVARTHKAALAPFLLDGFADQPDMFQSDHIHPTAKAQQKMLDNVWPHLQPLLAVRGKR
jgi:acyl-CoA thioesterase-1